MQPAEERALAQLEERYSGFPNAYGATYWIGREVHFGDLTLAPETVQAAALPVYLATGHVVIAGIGNGYLTASIAEKPDVKSVNVVEKDRAKIDAFNTTYSKFDGFGKVQIFEEQPRDTIRGAFCDLMYVANDGLLLNDRLIHDIEVYTSENTIKEIMFFGLEHAILSALQLDMIGMHDVPDLLKLHFIRWLLTPAKALYPPRDAHPDAEYLSALLNAVAESGASSLVDVIL